MRLVSYAGAGGESGYDPSWRAGLVRGDQVHDAGELAARLDLDVEIATVRDLLELSADVLAEFDSAQARGLLDESSGLSRSSLRIGPPVPDPEKIICVGLNYREHAGEVDMEIPPAPILFAKFRNSLIGSGEAIALPAQSTEVDYEGELAIVIGRRAKDVPVDRALEYVAGCMPFNDVSARDLQMKVSQWTAGKAMDTFAPCGPELVLRDEVPSYGSLTLATRINGEVLQEADTSLMLFDVPTLVSYVSSVMTLVPGDVIATGTPAGVGFTRDPQVFLRPGDQVEVEISGVGVLRNPVTATL